MPTVYIIVISSSEQIKLYLLKMPFVKDLSAFLVQVACLSTSDTCTTSHGII